MICPHHKTLQEQIVLGVTLMVLEGAIDGDQPNIFKNSDLQSLKKECPCMSMILNFNHCPSVDQPVAETITDTINELIDKDLQHKNTQQPQRDYLGASRLGVVCARALQYEYTHAPRDSVYSGKTLRIFELGHTLEKMAWNWLQGAGFEIETHQPKGDPYGFSAADGLIRGHVDGIIKKVPAGLNIRVPALWECKSMNAKSWKQMVEKGVKVAKPIYAVQIALYQAYMEGVVTDLSQNSALLTAVNKDTSELYHELVPFDPGLAQTASDRAFHILRATQAGETLPRISHNSECFECRFCDWKQTCWKESL